MTNRAIRLRQYCVRNVPSQTVVNTHSILNGGGQILPNAFSVEDVSTLGLDGILCEIITKSTDGGFAFDRDELG
jgi:hypothetical protein